MDAEAAAAPAPPAAEDGWTIVDRPEAGRTGELAEPGSESPGEPRVEPEEHQDGLRSPESERLADDLLREPFQAGGLPQLQVAVPSPVHTVEEPSTPTASSGPAVGSCGDLGGPHAAHGPTHIGGPPTHIAAPAWGFDRQRERLRAASRLSGEGALEGFQDPQDLMLAHAAAPQIGGGSGDDSDSDASSVLDADDAVVSLGWEGLAGGLAADVAREMEDLKALVATAATALWGCVQEGRMAVEEWAAAVQASANQAAKTIGRSVCPLWAFIGMSGLAAMALTALAAQLYVSRRLAMHVRQRDRDMARLVVKILNLQDALQSAARASLPLLRHTSLGFTTTTTLIGMV